MRAENVADSGDYAMGVGCGQNALIRPYFLASYRMAPTSIPS